MPEFTDFPFSREPISEVRSGVSVLLLPGTELWKVGRYSSNNEFRPCDSKFQVLLVNTRMTIIPVEQIPNSNHNFIYALGPSSIVYTIANQNQAVLTNTIK